MYHNNMPQFLAKNIMTYKIKYLSRVVILIQIHFNLASIHFIHLYDYILTCFYVLNFIWNIDFISLVLYSEVMSSNEHVAYHQKVSPAYN